MGAQLTLPVPEDVTWAKLFRECIEFEVEF